MGNKNNFFVFYYSINNKKAIYTEKEFLGESMKDFDKCKISLLFSLLGVIS